MEGTCFDEDWAAVAASEAALQRVIARLHQAGSERLGPIMGRARRVGALAEAGQVGALAEGLSRGDVRASDAASPAGWVRQWAPTYVAGGAAALVRVTEAIAKPLQRAAGRGGARGPGAGVQRRRRHRRDGQAAAPADPGVPRHGAGRVRGAGRGAGAAPDPGAAAGADREVRPPGGVPAAGGPAQARHRPVPAVRRRRDGRVPAPARPGGLGGAGGDPRPAGRAATLDRARVGPPDQRPAPGRRPGGGLPPRRRGRRVPRRPPPRRRWS